MVSPGALDLATALKLSDEISGEIVPERLIDKMLRTAVEHGRAHRALLIVPSGGELRIEAEAKAAGAHVTVQQGDSAHRSIACLPLACQGKPTSGRRRKRQETRWSAISSNHSPRTNCWHACAAP